MQTKKLSWAQIVAGKKDAPMLDKRPKPSPEQWAKELQKKRRQLRKKAYRGRCLGHRIKVYECACICLDCDWGGCACFGEHQGHCCCNLG